MTNSEVTLNIDSPTCYLIACVFEGQKRSPECTPEEKVVIQKNIDTLLNKMELNEFKLYFQTIEQMNWAKSEEVAEEIIRIGESVIDPTKEDKAKFIAELQAMIHNKK